MATRLCWLGHATLLLESDNYKILMDPFLTGNPKATMKADEVEANFIIVSHGHGDHVGDAVPIAQRTEAMVIANYEIMGWLQKQGLTKVHGQQHGGSYQFPFGRVKFTQAWHGSVLPDGTYGGNPCGIHLFLKDGCRIYNAADTALFSDMKLIGEDGVDLAILPIGDNFTMGPDDALKAVKFIQPKKVMPIHYNTWDLIAQDANAWAERVRQETPAQPLVPKPGEWIEV
jgi:L-ascorbate metabolism protein UlaG (beta-lactamase superfamily)